MAHCTGILHQAQHQNQLPSVSSRPVYTDCTLECLRQEAYWVNMARDVEKHCTECQQTKPPAPQRVPLTNTPIGRPWQMVAVDILEVPVSSRNNRHLLVVQDYFTKSADAIPLRDQTANRITEEVMKLFAT